MASAAASPEIAVGTVLGDTYEITGLVGRGGMGAVWGARHLRLPGKRVAVKVLLGAPAADSEAFARFRREAEIASRIGHPNIVQVIDFNTLASGTPYLVLEFLDGEDLRARLRRGPLPLGAAIQIARQIGSALHAAHREGVVHRDLKPENVFLCPTDAGGVVSDHVKVLDFGVSKIRGSQTVMTQEAAVIGTPQYMAPEQAAGKNTAVDARSDQFALGSMVYEMLCGRPPFSGESLAEIVFKVVYEEPPPLAHLVPSLPPKVAGAVMRAMRKEQEARFADVSTFLAELSGQPLSTLDRTKSGSGGPPATAAGAGAGPPSAARTPGAASAASDVGTAKTVADSAEAYAATVDSQKQQPAPIAAPDAKTEKTVAPSGPVVASVAPATTPTAGEVSPPRAPGGSKTWVFAAGAAAVLVIAVGAYVAGTRGAKSTAQTPTTTAGTTPIAPDATPVHVAAKPASPDAHVAAAVAEPPDAAAAAKKPVAIAKPDTKPDTKPPADEDAAEPKLPELIAELAQAEGALDARRWDDAIRLARHSLTIAKTPRAWGIMTRAYCGQGDLGNAKASLLHLRGARRAQAIAACTKLGLELQD